MRLWPRTLLGLVLVAGLSGPGHAETDLSTMQPSEIEALQKRLTDCACYAGPIDGQASAATTQAVKACPDQNPVLRIETGTHTAPIRSIGVDASCRLMVTGSLDKTVRLWSLPDGRLLRTIRPPIGSQQAGRFDVVAISPNGDLVAAGGLDAAFATSDRHSVYEIDLSSGSVRRLGRFENTIDHLAFSADGLKLAIALNGTAGIRVLDVASGIELMADREFGGQSYGVAFAPDGSLFAVGYDGFVRRYGPDLVRSVKAKVPGGLRPYGIAVDPAGRRIAVGYSDTANVSILDASTLTSIKAAETHDVTNAIFAAVAWTADGRHLLAAGTARRISGGVWRDVVRRFDVDGRWIGDTPVSIDTILGLVPCGSGIAFGAGDPTFGLLSVDGRSRTLQRPMTSDMRDKVGAALMVSPDGSSVRFGLEAGGKRAVLFDLKSGALVAAPVIAASLLAARTRGLPVSNWLNDMSVTFDGKPLVLEPYERSHALAVRSDRSGFVIGAEFSLRAFDASGHERWKHLTSVIPWGTVFVDGDEIIVVAQGDGTIRWHRWSDGQELLALFVQPDTKSWVAWTPSGYYMASPGAEDLIGWNVNRGWEQQADFFPASRFRDKFSRPDIVRLVLKTLDESAAVKQANDAAHKRDDTQPLIERLPPIITILSPTEGSTAAAGTVEVRYRTRISSSGEVDRVEAFVDGAKIDAKGLGPSAGAPASPDGTAVLTLPMPAHDAEISLVAYAAGKASEAARVRLKGVLAAAPPDDPDALKPNLYALLVGVTHYENKAFDLSYAAADAVDVGKALKAQEGRLYRHVEVRVLTDKSATSTEVKKGLLWLQHQTTAHDLALIFASGHGMTDAKGKFWFLTEDADPDALLVTAVSQDDISGVLYDLPGKKLVLLDACHSGAALGAGEKGLAQTDVSTAVNDFAQAEGGVVAYSASTGKEFSFENEQWGHGAFTKALIEGLGGKADLLHTGTVTTATLDLFLENRVKELTGGRQHPVMNRPKTVPDFPVATVQPGG